MTELAVRGPLLIPHVDGRVDYHPDGLLAGNAHDRITHAGPVDDAPADLRDTARPARGVILPPFVDIHTHIPQHPIRGRFIEGVPDDAPQGKLLAGLQRNVFPAEARCHDQAHAAQVVDAFLDDTRSHGVLGGAAYMTSSPAATTTALKRLPDPWQLGLVLMERNCPPELQTDADEADRCVADLAQRFGQRVIVTDRFAVAVDSPLRQRQSALAGRLGLRTQTHLNEQVAEKSYVEQDLFPHAASYTDVYRRDGLLDHRCIVAHCIYMRDDEWDILADHQCVVAHCPTSNALLGSGTMPLDEVVRRGLPYAIATDVGASPTVSMLAEMRRFMQVHQGKSPHATAREALVRATVAPACLLNLQPWLNGLTPGQPLSFIEVEPLRPAAASTAEALVQVLMPENPDQPEGNVARATLRGEVVFDRSANHA